MLNYEKLVLGELDTNCYLVWDEITKQTAIVDPADGAEDISEEIQRLNLKPVIILATHGHFDHLLAAIDLKLIFNIPIGVSTKDMFLLERQNETAEFFLHHKIKAPNINKVEVDLSKINRFKLGDEEILIINTPGHTPGGVCFYSKNNKILFTGDTLFSNGIFGDDKHKYSSPFEMKKSLEKIYTLPKDTKILPGHGEEGILNRN